MAQGSAYKLTKEPINYRGPSSDRTRYFQTETSLPAAICPARSFHVTKIVSKTQSVCFHNDMISTLNLKRRNYDKITCTSITKNYVGLPNDIVKHIYTIA